MKKYFTPSSQNKLSFKKQKVWKKPKPITEHRLYNIALYYLQRHIPTEQQFRNFLNRKIYKASLHHPTDKDLYSTWINSLVEKVKSLHYLNDTLYTENKINSLSKKGWSNQKIKTTLKQKGLKENVISHFIEENEYSEEEKLHIFIKKKKLGPYSKNPEETQKKDISICLRQGYSYTMILNVFKKSIDKAEDSQ